MSKLSYDEIIVIISHPHGDVEVELSEWIKIGPGERPFLQPTSVKQKSTGKPMSLHIIPLKYRNNRLSRFLISLGLIENPWDQVA